MLSFLANADLHGKSILVLFLGVAALAMAAMGFFFDEMPTCKTTWYGSRSFDTVSGDADPTGFDRRVLYAFIIGLILTAAGVYGCWAF